MSFFSLYLSLPLTPPLPFTLVCLYISHTLSTTVCLMSQISPSRSVPACVVVHLVYEVESNTLLM